MSNFSDKYNKILSDIEENISNEEEKKYVISKLGEISSIYMEIVDRITKLDDERIEKLEEQQDKMINTISKMQETLNLIKSDIYEDDCCDFEIVCPYCNHEFVADIESELKEEIECPECHNVIELDWGEDDEEDGCSSCHGHCHSCGSHNEELQDEEDDIEDDEYDEDNDDEQDEDM